MQEKLAICLFYRNWAKGVCLWGHQIRGWVFVTDYGFADAKTFVLENYQKVKKKSARCQIILAADDVFNTYHLNDFRAASPDTTDTAVRLQNLRVKLVECLSLKCQADL